MAHPSVTLAKHQAGDTVTARDLNAVQSNIDAAIRMLSDRVVLVQTEPLRTNSPGFRGDVWVGKGGTIKACIADNHWVTISPVVSDGLDASLLQNFHVELASDSYAIGPGTAIPFATLTFGGEQWSSSTTLALSADARMRIHACAQLRQGASPLLPGARALLYMVDNGGNVVAPGAWREAVIDGTDGTPEIFAEFDREIPLSAGTTKTYSICFAAQQADGSPVTGWVAMVPAYSVGGPRTGTYCEGMVVPRPSTG